MFQGFEFINAINLNDLLVVMLDEVSKLRIA